MVHEDPCSYLCKPSLQALSNTVWGFSKLEVVHEKLLDAVAAIALRKLNLFNGQNIANTVSPSLTELKLSETQLRPSSSDPAIHSICSP